MYDLLSDLEHYQENKPAHGHMNRTWKMYSVMKKKKNQGMEHKMNFSQRYMSGGLVALKHFTEYYSAALHCHFWWLSSNSCKYEPY